MSHYHCKNIALLSLLIAITVSPDSWARNNRKQLPAPHALTAQEQLNQQVLAQPLSSESDAALSESLNEATKRGQPSKSTTQTNYYQYYYNGYYYPYAAYRLGYWY